MSRATLKSFMYALSFVVTVTAAAGSSAVASSRGGLPLRNEAATSILRSTSLDRTPIVCASASSTKDPSANYVYAYDQRSGSLLLTYGPFAGPAYIATDRKNNLYAADVGAGVLSVYPSGQTTASKTTTISGGFGCDAGGSIAVDRGGNIWVAFATAQSTGNARDRGVSLSTTRRENSSARSPDLRRTFGNDHIWANSESGTHHGWIYEYAYPSGGLPPRRIQPGDFINGIAITPYATPG
jgi:hypothetical protein